MTPTTEAAQRPVLAMADPPADHGTTRRYTLVYDGDCAACTRFVRMVERWDRGQAIATVPSQRENLSRRFPWISAAQYREAVQLIGPGGETWAGAAAVERLLDVVPRGWVFRWLFRLPFAGRAADRCYRWFARNRYRLGCGSA